MSCRTVVDLTKSNEEVEVVLRGLNAIYPGRGFDVVLPDLTEIPVKKVGMILGFVAMLAKALDDKKHIRLAVTDRSIHIDAIEMA